MMRGRRGDDGQATVLMIVVVVVVVAVCAALLQLGELARIRARAQSVADLVALAAVRDESFAPELARANRATLRAVVRSGDTVQVTVAVEDVVADASAEPDPRR